MGGQACVFYGAAEFSRDLDLLILPGGEALSQLLEAFEELQAERIAVPEARAEFLERGHAIHFRCQAAGVEKLRIDIMGKLRGVAGFEELWARRSSLEVDGVEIDLLSLEDLVRAKKTQQDKDWPMIRRLAERVYFETEGRWNDAQLEFLFRELPTGSLLVRLAAERPEAAKRVARERAAVGCALQAEAEQVAAELAREEQEERRQDRAYWRPLREELESLRRQRPRPGGPQESN